MQNHSTGNLRGTRLGSVITRTSWLIPLNRLVSGTDYKLCVIPATTSNPSAYRARIVVYTASDAATTDVLRIGTTSGGTELFNDVDLKSAAGTNLIITLDPLKVNKADVTLYFRQTVTGAKTVGEFIIIVEPFEINVADFSDQES